MIYKFKEGEMVAVDVSPKVGDIPQWEEGRILRRGVRSGRIVYDVEFSTFEMFGHSILNYREEQIKRI